MATNNSIDSNIPIGVSKGGTNASSMATNYGVAYYDGSKIVTIASVGTSGQALTSNGAGSVPTFQNFTPSGGVGTASFLGHLISNQTVPTGVTAKVKFTSIDFNVGSAYSSSTGNFTAPVSGYYLSSISLQLSGDGTYSTTWSGTGSFSAAIGAATVTKGIRERPGATSSLRFGKCNTFINYLDFGDVGDFLIKLDSTGGAIHSSATATYGSIFLVG